MGSWLRNILLLSLCGSISVLTARALSKEAVRAELLRMQLQNGIHLISVADNKLNVIDFSSRSLKIGKQIASRGLSNGSALTSDGTKIAFNDCSPPEATSPIPNNQPCASVWPHLATIHADGTHFQQYPGFVYPGGMCWSHDKTKLALSVSDRRENKSAVQNVFILDLNSGHLQQVAGFENWTMTQCWSVDDKQFVYMENKVGGIQNVFVYDTDLNESRLLASGARPTWSPDGKWISFLVDDDDYYVVHPNGDGRKLLFKAGIGVTDLQWSPDSRFVAYVSARGMFERSLSEQFAELTRLRVRRLDDNSEDWFLNLTNNDPISFQWVQSPTLLGDTR